MRSDAEHIGRVLQQAMRERPAIRSVLHCGSDDLASDLDLYVLLDEPAQAGAVPPDYGAIGRWIRATLAEAGVPRCQPFVLTMREFLNGRRASCNGGRSLDESLCTELASEQAVATEEEVFDDPDYSLTKVAWSYVTASPLAGEDVSRAVAAARVENGVTERGCVTWLKHSYLMSLVNGKTLVPGSARLSSKLGKCYIRMAYSEAVRALVRAHGALDRHGDRVLRARPPGDPLGPDLLGVLVSEPLRGLPMDTRYLLALRESEDPCVAKSFSPELLEDAHRFRNVGTAATAEQVQRLRTAIERMARPFLPVDFRPR